MTQTARDDGLAGFGYKQELDRTLGTFHTFAAGISYISILTGTFQLFYVGFALGGPAYWWSWPMVFLGQLLVALSFAELAGPPPSAAAPSFSLGRFGLPVNVLAVLWGLAMIVNLAWPRREIYNASPPYHWYLQYGAVLFIGVVMVGGLAYYWLVLRHRIGVLAAHAAEEAP